MDDQLEPMVSLEDMDDCMDDQKVPLVLKHGMKDA